MSLSLSVTQQQTQPAVRFFHNSSTPPFVWCVVLDGDSRNVSAIVVGPAPSRRPTKDHFANEYATNESSPPGWSGRIEQGDGGRNVSTCASRPVARTESG